MTTMQQQDNNNANDAEALNDQFKAVLETMIAARSWPLARASECYPEVPSTCVRCGSAPETDLHVFWQCPANKNIDDACVKDTQVLIKQAEAGSVEFPCFWLRGMVPASFTHVSPDCNPIKDVNIQYIQEDNINWNSNV